MKARTALIPVVAVAIGPTACGGDDDPAENAGARTAPEETIATIGTRTIKKDEFERHVAFARRTYQRDAPPPKRRLEEDTLDKLLLQAAIDQEAAKRGIRISDREARGIERSGGNAKRCLDSLPQRWRARAVCEPAYRTDNCRGS